MEKEHKVQKWEYKVQKWNPPGGKLISVEELNTLGEEGWELVMHTYEHFYFKRPKPEIVQSSSHLKTGGSKTS